MHPTRVTPTPRRPDNVRLVTAAVVALTGLLWIGQGLGYLQGDSFMVGDPLWAAIGAVFMGIGAFLAWQEFDRRRRAG